MIHPVLKGMKWKSLRHALERKKTVVSLLFVNMVIYLFTNLLTFPASGTVTQHVVIYHSAITSCDGLPLNVPGKTLELQIFFF